MITMNSGSLPNDGGSEEGSGSPSNPNPIITSGETVSPSRTRSQLKFAFLVLLMLTTVFYLFEFPLSSTSTSASTALVSKLYTTLTLTGSSVDGEVKVLKERTGKKPGKLPNLAVFYNDTFTVQYCHKYLHKRPGSTPSFLVAGVHKGGSTAIFGYLTRHGYIRPACCKEVNFFTVDKIWKRGMEYYLRHFPDLTNLPHVVTGEGTPNYIRDPYAPSRIQRLLPNVKIVVSFRDPVERFVSHFVGQIVNAKLRKQTPVKDCNLYIRKNLDALSRCVKSTKPSELSLSSPANATASAGMKPAALTVGLPQGSCLLKNRSACLYHRCASLKYESAISRSIYVDQLERWLMYFPPERLHIVQAERLFKATADTMQGVARFLELREYNEAELQSFASTHRGSSHMADPISGRCDRKALTKFFRPFNERFYQLLKLNWPEAAAKWQPWPK